MIEHSEGFTPEARKIGIGDSIDGLHIPCTYVLGYAFIIEAKKHLANKKDIVLIDIIYYPTAAVVGVLMGLICTAIFLELDLVWTGYDFAKIVDKHFDKIYKKIGEELKPAYSHLNNIASIKLYPRK